MSESTTDQVISPPVESFLPEKMFRSYIKGNVLLPQSGAGMNTLLIKDILNGQNTFSDYYNSSFSDQQLELIGKTMNNVHSRMENPVPFKYDKDARDEKAHPDSTSGPFGTYSSHDLQSLWSRLKDNTIHSALKVLGLGNNFVVSLDDAKELDVFINEPQNHKKIEVVKESLERMSYAFEDKRFKEAAIKYRDATANTYFLRTQGGTQKVNMNELIEDYKAIRNEIKTVIKDIMKDNQSQKTVSFSVVDDIFEDFE